jgi:hypothetical protein
MKGACSSLFVTACVDLHVSNFSLLASFAEDWLISILRLLDRI